MRLFLLMVALALGAPARAADEERFGKLDYDQDGKISKAEAAGNADLIEGFDRFDRNKDGKLSRAEYNRLTRRSTAAAKPSSAAGSTAPRRARR